MLDLYAFILLAPECHSLLQVRSDGYILLMARELSSNQVHGLL